MAIILVRCACIAGFMLFAGCASPAPTPSEFTNIQPLQINARRLEIIENWQMPLTSPYIEHTLSPNLSSLIINWASGALIPAGGSGEIVVDIIQASVKLTDLPASTNLSDIFKNEQTSKVRADIKIKLIWIQPVSGQQAILELTANSSATLKDSLTPNARQLAIRNVMEDAISRLDLEARQEITTISGIIRP